MGRARRGKKIVGGREMEVKGAHCFSSLLPGQKLGMRVLALRYPVNAEEMEFSCIAGNSV